MILPAPEPECRPWKLISTAELWARLLTGRDADLGRPWIVAVDGRSGSGKSTLAARLAAAATFPVEVVHTDDVAWYESFFGWDDLLAEHVLTPVRAGRPVRFVPPAWSARHREGAVQVSARCSVLLVEGVGAFRRSLAPLVDTGVYVQSDRGVGLRRLVDRDGAMPESRAFIAEWDRAERPFLAAERPWRRAAVVLAGTTPDDLPEAPADAVYLGTVPVDDVEAGLDEGRGAT